MNRNEKQGATKSPMDVELTDDCDGAADMSSARPPVAPMDDAEMRRLERDALEPEAILTTVSWAGPVGTSVRVLAKTPKRYRVRLTADALLPQGQKKAGDVVLVPHGAIHFEDKL